MYKSAVPPSTNLILFIRSSFTRLSSFNSVHGQFSAAEDLPLKVCAPKFNVQGMPILVYSRLGKVNHLWIQGFISPLALLTILDVQDINSVLFAEKIAILLQKEVYVTSSGLSAAERYHQITYIALAPEP